MGTDEELVEAVLRDWETAPVSEEVRAVLRFLRKLTLEPEQIAPADIEALREAGVSDPKIYDAIHVGALFNIINRVTATLGIEALPRDLARRGAEFVHGAGY